MRFTALILASLIGLGASVAAAETLVFSNGLQVRTAWDNMPQARVETKLWLQFERRADLVPASPTEEISVELWMPSMGHGSRPTVVKPVLDAAGAAVPGAFEVSKVYFVMGGDWEVRVHLTAANGQRETQSFALELPGGHHH